MEEIDISQLLNYFRTKIIYILFVTSIFFCFSSIYVNVFRVHEYTSNTTILLNQTNESSTISATDVTLNNSLITTYSEIIKSKRVLRNVIKLLDLDMEYEELSKKVSVSEVNDTSIIKISVTDEDADLAASIANEIADVFSEEIVKIYNIENVSIIDQAETATSSSSASALKIIAVATLAGTLLSMGVIFVLFYFDTTVKNEEDIEKATGLPVIGIVPISREKIKTSERRKYFEEGRHKTEFKPVKKEVRKVEKTFEEVPQNPENL